MMFKNFIKFFLVINFLPFSFYSYTMEQDLSDEFYNFQDFIEDDLYFKINDDFRDTIKLFIVILEKCNSLDMLKQKLLEHANKNQIFEQIIFFINELSHPHQYWAKSFLHSLKISNYSQAEAKLPSILNQIDTIQPTTTGLITKLLMLKLLISKVNNSELNNLEDKIIQQSAFPLLLIVGTLLFIFMPPIYIHEHGKIDFQTCTFALLFTIYSASIILKFYIQNNKLNKIRLSNTLKEPLTSRLKAIEMSLDTL